MRVMKIDEIAAEPWKNGGGTTRTIAARNGDWRVSIAEVGRDGPYSRFDGIARISCVLRGAGAMLRHGDDVVALKPYHPTCYDGAIAWQAALIGGPVSALNVMTRIGQYRARVCAIEAKTVAQAGCVVALDAPCRIGNHDVLDAGHALVIDRLEQAIEIAPLSDTYSPPVLVTIESI
ncbi:HutD family protein [Caballeronia sp. GACF4]|uniref:HutD/Ves family protein n=1 Tax=Caballeronia sp. GACF4 TaxID=2921763 RepID=UPI002027EBD7|nr:HutD family protein [Caballeronia sp. GACF4]